jgi:hypothetical protein
VTIHPFSWALQDETYIISRQHIYRPLARAIFSNAPDWANACSIGVVSPLLRVLFEYSTKFWLKILKIQKLSISKNKHNIKIFHSIIQILRGIASKKILIFI